jgi:cytochrome c
MDGRHFPSGDNIRRCAAFASVTLAAVLGAIRAQAAGDVARGEILYQGCQDCHSIEKNDVGPMHKGVVGRLAGTVPGYNYSPALKNAKLVWTEANLDKWLTNPQAFIPGVRMFFQVNSAQDRADLIAFLKERAK